MSSSKRLSNLSRAFDAFYTLVFGMTAGMALDNGDALFAAACALMTLYTSWSDNWRRNERS